MKAPTDDPSLLGLVLKSAKQLGDLFHKDELAYLALTQKAEHAVRDRLAFALHRNLQDFPSLLVCREWRRCDLAILEATADGSIPRLLLEAKALATTDIVRPPSSYRFWEQIQADLLKSSHLIRKDYEVVERGIESIAMMIVTRCHSVPDKKFSAAVKYHKMMTTWASLSHEMPDVEMILSKRMAELERIAPPCTIEAGDAFGIRVSLHIWFYRLPAIRRQTSDDLRNKLTS